MQYRRLNIEGAAYFFTVVTHKRQPIFREPTAVNLLHSCIEAVRAKHPFTIEAQVILRDHLHAIWQLPDGDANYSTRWRLIKEAFTRAYRKRNGSPPRSARQESRGEQTVWQRRYWEHAIHDERDFEEHLDYIHANPVRHGLVQAPRDWPHSTFHVWAARGRYELHWGDDEMPPLPKWAENVE